MAEGTSTRFGFHTWGADTDTFSRTELMQNFTALEGKGVKYLEGFFSALPSPSAATAFTIWHAVDTGQFFFGSATDWTDISPFHAVYGSGLDGDVTLVTNKTLDRDYHYNTLVVPGGITVNTAGFHLFARKSIVCNGNIQCNGNPGIGIAGGGAIGSNAGTLGIGFAGGSAGTPGGTGTAAGFTGSGSFPSTAATGNTQTSKGRRGGRGGYGGTGSLGNYSGSTLYQGPDATVVNVSDLFLLPVALLGQIPSNWPPGTNIRVDGGMGGVGGIAGTGNGGGGGGGGGVVVVCTPSLTGNGTVAANGGSGGGAATGNAGGGGGGGGGVVILVAVNRSTVSVLADGGVGGAGTGSGTTGTTGEAGTIVELKGA